MLTADLDSLTILHFMKRVSNFSQSFSTMASEICSEHFASLSGWRLERLRCCVAVERRRWASLAGRRMSSTVSS